LQQAGKRRRDNKEEWTRKYTEEWNMKVQKINNKCKEEPKMESRRGMKGKMRGYRTGEDDVMHTSEDKRNLRQKLTFRGPCVVIYSYDKNQRDALLIKFILV
jgi:hypothetical protein